MRSMSAHAKDFAHAIAEAYATTSASIELGAGVCDGTVEPEAAVRIPLAMMNRHGLIAGATGTGKTRTLQLLAEQLSAAGVPTFVADMKGDLSGLAVAGSPDSPAAKRNAQLQVDVKQQGFPVEYLALGGIGAGVPVRATVSDFGPQLLAKVLGANETQEQSLGLVFRYADEKGLPLLDLSDLRALLTFLSSKEGKAELTGIGGWPCLADARRALARARDPRGRRWERAPVRHRRPAVDGRRRVRDHLLPRAPRGPGEAEALLDGDDVAARGAVRATPRGRGRREAEARLSLRRGPPPVRGRNEGITGVGRANGAAHPLEGRRGVLRDAHADRRPRGRAGAARNRIEHALRAFTPRTRRRSSPPSRRFRSRTSTTSRRCWRSSESARRPSRFCPNRACRRPVVHTRLRGPGERAPRKAWRRRRKRRPCTRNTEHGFETASARELLAESAWPIKISRAHRAAAASLARTEMPPTRSVAATWATS